MHRLMTIGVAATVISTLGCQSTQERPPQQAAFSMQEFKAHHGEIKEHLGHIDLMTQRLAGEPPEKQRETMAFVVRFLREHILTHAADEEATLYPMADDKAGPRITASMRYEHGVLAAWVTELGRIASSPSPDIAAFVRRAQRALGLLEAHFGAEEEVIAPVVAG